MSVDLDDQTALVTGAGKGIGRGCAEALAAAGAKVIAVARSEADLASLAGAYPGRIEPWSMDVTRPEFISRVESLEKLHILVNNAGGNRPQAFLDVDTDALDFMMDLNVRASFLTSQAAARVMVREKTAGSIVQLSSQMAHVGSPRRTVYCMTKHALEGLTKAMAIELAPLSIRVNTVAPTFVETPLTSPMLQDAEFRQFVLGRIPMGRLATIDEVVAAVMFLVSPGAGMVTGHSLLVDGGWTAQ